MSTGLQATQHVNLKRGLSSKASQLEKPTLHPPVSVGSLVPKIDLHHHAAATSAAYHMHASIVAVEAGFMQGGIVPLLQDPDLMSVVRDAHEAANLAWQHPADGDALARELQRGSVFDPDDTERKACGPAHMN